MRRSPSPNSDTTDDALADVPQVSARDAARGELQASVQEIAAGTGRRFLIVRYRKPLAALVSLDDLRMLLRLEGWTWNDLELLKRTMRGDEPAQEDNEDA